MARKKTTEKQPSSIFKRSKIETIRDIAEIYIFFPISQQLVDSFIAECAKFLHIQKGIDVKLIEKNFKIKFFFSNDQSYIELKGNNLLSSLWIIDVFPKNPERLSDCSIYQNGDFVYKFYTKNKNLSIEQIKQYERKSANNT
jgi:hypothetical protein